MKVVLGIESELVRLPLAADRGSVTSSCTAAVVLGSDSKLVFLFFNLDLDEVVQRERAMCISMRSFRTECAKECACHALGDVLAWLVKEEGRDAPAIAKQICFGFAWWQQDEELPRVFCR